MPPAPSIGLLSRQGRKWRGGQPAPKIIKNGEEMPYWANPKFSCSLCGKKHDRQKKLDMHLEKSDSHSSSLFRLIIVIYAYYPLIFQSSQRIAGESASPATSSATTSGKHQSAEPASISAGKSTSRAATTSARKSAVTPANDQRYSVWKHSPSENSDFACRTYTPSSFPATVGHSTRPLIFDRPSQSTSPEWRRRFFELSS